MNAGPATAERTPLEERLISLIKANGPITVADFMADALGHPHDGYYMSQTPIGAEGDFTTAPEISQIFGELIGLWLVQSWIDMGEPKAFNLVEFARRASGRISRKPSRSGSSRRAGGSAMSSSAACALGRRSPSGRMSSPKSRLDRS
jgi:hypothetical protein